MKWEQIFCQDAVPEPDAQRKEEARKKLLCEMQQYRMTDLQFICGQIRFVKPALWAAQLFLWLLICFGVYCVQRNGMQEYRLYSLVSMVTPFLFVLQIEQFARIYRKTLLEIELTTFFSLKKLFLARLLIFGIVDLVGLMGWILFLHVGTTAQWWRIGLYSLVPFNLMVAGLFYLLRYERNGCYNYMAVGYLIVLGGCFDLFPRWHPGIYRVQNVTGWLVALVITMLLGMWSVGIVLKNSMEEGRQNEIKLGANDEMLWR